MTPATRVGAVREVLAGHVSWLGGFAGDVLYELQSRPLGGVHELESIALC